MLIILLVAEGCVVTLLAVAYVGNLLRAVSDQRHSLAACFLNIPTGFVRALASKQVGSLGSDYTAWVGWYHCAWFKTELPAVLAWRSLGKLLDCMHGVSGGPHTFMQLVSASRARPGLA